MNLNYVKVSVLVLVLVAESQGGLVGGVYERIKNTTTGLTIDVKNAWSYGKGLVLPSTETEQKEPERGFLGGMFHSAHEKIHYLHEEIWNVEEIPNDCGLLWNMYNRLLQRLKNAKHFILGDEEKTPAEVITKPPNPEAVLIMETMEKLFNPDGTRKVTEAAFREAIEKLKKEIVELRNTEAKVEDGEGLIDIRLSRPHSDLNDNIAEADAAAAGIYAKVRDNANAAKDNMLSQANAEANKLK